MSYGICPECGCPGISMERRPNGDASCINRHKFKPQKVPDLLARIKELEQKLAASYATAPAEIRQHVPDDWMQGYVQADSEAEARSGEEGYRRLEEVKDLPLAPVGQATHVNRDDFRHDFRRTSIAEAPLEREDHTYGPATPKHVQVFIDAARAIDTLEAPQRVNVIRALAALYGVTL